MNLLIVGSGAREHAFAWKIYNSSFRAKIFVTNANPGTIEIANSLMLDINDFKSIKQAILNNSISMVLIGPEIPLINGVCDFIKSDPDLLNVHVIGPSRAGSQLEGSKEFAKEFMIRHAIPTASYKSFTKSTYNNAVNFINENNPPFVLKADGPAAGKGVIIIDNKKDAISNLKEMLIDRKFGDSSNKVVIEEFLSGIEMSCFVLFDGLNYKILPYAKDYKRIGEGDEGLNTGGMGSISPVNFLDDNLKNKIENDIVIPTINGLIKDNIDYVGFIFIGLINVNSNPKVIEYNVRMGDPETQVVLPRIKNDFYKLLTSCANKKLNKIQLEIDNKYFTNVVLASKGYPESYEKGLEIKGLDKVKNSIVFQAGTELKNDKLTTNGGRVLSVVSSDMSMTEALKKSYSSISKIDFKGKVFRKDIGFDL